MAVKIRAVDRHVANRASLILRCLVMEIWRARRSAESRASMALQTKDIEVARLEQMRIGRAMWRMARFAAFCLDCWMLENERSLLVHVTRKADGVPRCGRAQLLADESSVGVVAIGALNKAFLNAMVERHIELRLHLEVARVAELRLGVS